MAKERLYSSDEVAQQTGRAVRTIQKLSERYPNLGIQIHRTWVYRQADIDFIKTINPKGGRPPLKKPLAHAQDA